MSLLRTSSTYNERRLKNKIRERETNLRWVDFYAAEHAYESMSAHLRKSVNGGASGMETSIDSKANELVSDLVLLLSYLSSLGLHKLPLKSLKNYSAYFMYKHSESSAQIEDMLAQHPFVYDRGALETELLGETPAEQLDLWAEPSELDVSSKQGERSKQASSALPFLALDGGDLYLYRFWSMQNQILQWRDERLSQPLVLTEHESEFLGPVLRNLFKLESLNEELDFQALAAAQSMQSNLSLVSGGPGTGKTTTAAKIIVLHLLLAQRRAAEEMSNVLPNVVCLAPTGKAAQRLASGVREQAESLIGAIGLNVDDSVKDTVESSVKGGVGGNPYDKAMIQAALPDEGQTIHRYILSLGEKLDPLMRTKSKSFTARLASHSGGQDEGAPCLIVVDESSMVDLSLMQKLVSVTSNKTALVFLGDYFQLAPVEPGDVFGDWVREFSQQVVPAQQMTCLEALLRQDVVKGFEGQSRPCAVGVNPLTILRKSYRFTGALAECAELVKSGSVSAFQSFAATQTEESAVRVCRLDAPEAPAREVVGLSVEHLTAMRQAYEGYKACVLKKASLEVLNEAFLKVQILCSTYLGPYGADAINAEIDVCMRASALESVHNDTSVISAQANYHGRPILLTQNYAQYGLYNGDIGFMLEQPRKEGFMLVFYRDGAEAVSILPTRISGQELAYAMSIHKSQGSEYDDVHVVLAPYAKELLTRSLLYTGITRAKHKVNLYLDQQSIQKILV